jgi:hypothetical protein
LDRLLLLNIPIFEPKLLDYLYQDSKTLSRLSAKYLAAYSHRFDPHLLRFIDVLEMFVALPYSQIAPAFHGSIECITGILVYNNAIDESIFLRIDTAFFKALEMCKLGLGETVNIQDSIVQIGEQQVFISCYWRSIIAICEYLLFLLVSKSITPKEYDQKIFNALVGILTTVKHDGVLKKCQKILAQVLPLCNFTDAFWDQCIQKLVHSEFVSDRYDARYTGTASALAKVLSFCQVRIDDTYSSIVSCIENGTEAVQIRALSILTVLVEDKSICPKLPLLKLIAKILSFTCLFSANVRPSLFPLFAKCVQKLSAKRSILDFQHSWVDVFTKSWKSMSRGEKEQSYMTLVFLQNIHTCPQKGFIDILIKFGMQCPLYLVRKSCANTVTRYMNRAGQSFTVGILSLGLKTCNAMSFTAEILEGIDTFDDLDLIIEKLSQFTSANPHIPFLSEQIRLRLLALTEDFSKSRTRLDDSTKIDSVLD